MIDIDIRLEPDGIKRLAEKLLKLKANLEVQAKTALKQVGEQYYEIVVSNIGVHTGGTVLGESWAPLSRVWLEEKKRRGFILEIWEAETLIKQAVKVYDVESTPDGFKVFAGIKSGGPADSYDYKTALEKAIRNEFGAFVMAAQEHQPSYATHAGGTPSGQGIPARPLFGPAAREMVYNPAEKARMIETFKNATKVAISGIW